MKRKCYEEGAGVCFEISLLLCSAKNEMAENQKNFRMGCVSGGNVAY